VNSTYPVQLQLFGGILIVQTLPAVFGGLITSRLNKNGLIVGLVVSEIAGVYLMAAANKFTAWSTSFYTTYGLGAFFVGAIALAINLAIVFSCGPPSPGQSLYSWHSS
jgi:solute:Na+ symporter, SSS family